jgi:hypothetical protein
MAVSSRSGGTGIGFLQFDGDVALVGEGQQPWPLGAFWGTTFPSSSLVRWRMASSASSSAIRRLAAVSSDFSALLSPGSKPLSIRSCRRQV